MIAAAISLPMLFEDLRELRLVVLVAQEDVAGNGVEHAFVVAVLVEMRSSGRSSADRASRGNDS